ncbi:LPS-assembly protein LptD [Noviherbaspirillum cavernae]|uniref:LPS-assembly protein LptD n=1 Tax=Noviherbaspirillum cavernae TaxID=2320862 RepID=A0A418X3T0_9BURK|nr:LPS-assembly protein LptD [Noviherbaspirillum cavernae]RJG07086.1 LPS-assembly protein LptD [Noviherbaspirillum cavernae]
MTRLPLFPPSQRSLRILTAVVAAASVPALVSAQTAGARASKEDDKNAPSIINAEQMTGRPDREVFMERDVEINKGQTTVTSDKATYRIVEDEVEAVGNVRMRRFGDTYTADEFRYKMDSGEGYALNPTYRLGANNGQGQAERVDFEAEDRALVSEGTYSTCESPDPDWYLKADTLKLDSGLDLGVAYKSLLYFKGVPILATPAMSFPLSGERKSGFLPPTIGSTNRGGFEVTTPYYFNIAPNRDLTLYPRYMSRRGLHMGAEGRYLEPTFSGQTTVEGMLNDQVTKTDRWAVSSIHTHAFAPGWTYNWNINAASDDDYPSDFARSITGVTQRLLLRDMTLTYGSTYWSALARASNYQVLQDPLAPIGRPYDRLPQLMLTASRLDVGGFDWSVESDVTRWWHPNLVRGDRLYVNPKISYPLIHPGGFLTPKLALHASQYHLQNQVPGQPTNLSRVLPTFSIDSGLVFERDARFFGQSMTQTLEPRLFYVYTPYRNQNDFPIFDSGIADLSFAQLFSENRFVGNDRISDANQLTGAVVSRYIEPSGVERMRVAVGQRFYFEPQSVTLGAATNDSRSDMLVSATGRISQAVSVDGNLQYSQTQNIMNRANYGVRWQPAPKKVLNVAYRLDRTQNPQLEQVDVSGQWPIARRWYGAARVNYSLLDRRVAEGLLGLEYKADCWVFRVVGQRIPTSTGQATTSLFFQLELTGLARLGSNPLDAMQQSIPGYQLVTTPSNP